MPVAAWLVGILLPETRLMPAPAVAPDPNRNRPQASPCRDLRTQAAIRRGCEPALRRPGWGGLHGGRPLSGDLPAIRGGSGDARQLLVGSTALGKRCRLPESPRRNRSSPEFEPGGAIAPLAEGTCASPRGMAHSAPELGGGLPEPPGTASPRCAGAAALPALAGAADALPRERCARQDDRGSAHAARNAQERPLHHDGACEGGFRSCLRDWTHPGTCTGRGEPGGASERPDHRTAANAPAVSPGQRLAPASDAGAGPLPLLAEAEPHPQFPGCPSGKGSGGAQAANRPTGRFGDSDSWFSHLFHGRNSRAYGPGAEPQHAPPVSNTGAGCCSEAEHRVSPGAALPDGTDLSQPSPLGRLDRFKDDIQSVLGNFCITIPRQTRALQQRTMRSGAGAEPAPEVRGASGNPTGGVAEFAARVPQDPPPVLHHSGHTSAIPLPDHQGFGSLWLDRVLPVAMNGQMEATEHDPTPSHQLPSPPAHSEDSEFRGRLNEAAARGAWPHNWFPCEVDPGIGLPSQLLQGSREVHHGFYLHDGPSRDGGTHMGDQLFATTDALKYQRCPSSRDLETSEEISALTSMEVLKQQQQQL